MKVRLIVDDPDNNTGVNWPEFARQMSLQLTEEWLGSDDPACVVELEENN